MKPWVILLFAFFLTACASTDKLPEDSIPLSWTEEVREFFSPTSLGQLRSSLEELQQSLQQAVEEGKPELAAQLRDAEEELRVLIIREMQSQLFN